MNNILRVNIEHIHMLIGQLWNKDTSVPPLPLHKDDILEMFWTRLPSNTMRVPVRLVNNREAIIGNLKFEILLFNENKSK